MSVFVFVWSSVEKESLPEGGKKCELKRPRSFFFSINALSTKLRFELQTAPLALFESSLLPAQEAAVFLRAFWGRQREIELDAFYPSFDDERKDQHQANVVDTTELFLVSSSSAKPSAGPARVCHGRERVWPLPSLQL
jgi:hypothetical protein